MAIRLFNQYVHVAILGLIVVEAAIVALGVIGAILLVPGDVSGWLLLHGALWPKVAVAAVVLTLALAAMGLYRVGLRAELAGIYARIVTGYFVAGLGLTVLFYLFPTLAIPPGTLFIAGVVSMPVIFVVRALFTRLVDESLFKRRVLIYGAGRRASSLTRLRRKADTRGFEIVGFVSAPGDADVVVDACQLVDPNEGLPQIAQQRRVEEIVIAADDRRKRFPLDDLLECRLRGVDILDLTTFLERETGKLQIDAMHPSWLIFAEGFRRKPTRRLAQRVFDIVVSLVMLFFLWPFMLATAIAVLVDDGAPVLYRQVRVGQNGRPFELLKFRSMRRDAESAGKAVWAEKDDPRITRVGGFIRKSRLDELPQLINVLRGQMSFVGPRPERPEFVEELEKKIPFYKERHRVKPGITGWAQLCYPYGSSEQDALEKLQFDLYYVKNRSLLLDLMILIQTAEVVLWQKGSR